MRRWPNSDSMLAQRPRRLPSIKTTLSQTAPHSPWLGAPTLTQPVYSGAAI